MLPWVLLDVHAIQANIERVVLIEGNNFADAKRQVFNGDRRIAAGFDSDGVLKVAERVVCVSRCVFCGCTSVPLQ